jgi:hypothetical protein
MRSPPLRLSVPLPTWKAYSTLTGVLSQLQLDELLPILEAWINVRCH